VNVRKGLERVFRVEESGVIIALICIIAVTSLIRHDFFTLNNFMVMFIQITYIAIVALGVSIPLMVGNVDISTGNVAGMAAMIMSSMIVDYHVPSGLGIVIGLCGTMVMGLLNGILVVHFRMKAFIGTLGTLYIAGGLRYIFMRGHQLSLGHLGIAKLFQSRYVGMPIYFWFMILLLIILTFIIKRTIFGRNLLMIGDNPEVAELVGIKVNRNKMIAYVLSALFSGMAGIILALSVGLGSPEMGDGWGFRAIAGAVVGGTALGGGKSSPLGTFLGVTLMFFAESAIIFVGIPATMRVAVQGILMVLAVYVDLQRQKRKIPAM
jgi:ribose transport system permease protein